MGSIVVKKFLGEAPRVAEEELPDGAGQKVKNVKLHSGDLIPYKEPVFLQKLISSGVVKTLYKLTIPYDDIRFGKSVSSAFGGLYAVLPQPPDAFPLTTQRKGDNVFLTWDKDVDIVSSSPAWATSSDGAVADVEQRYYYTGDGRPKVSTYDKATRNAPNLKNISLPYTDGCYNLGLPIPTTALVATARSLSSAVSTHYERDAGNYATFYANADHGLRSGNIVTIRDFGSSDEAKSFNAQNVEITVTSTTTFTYFNSGDAVAKTANTNGRADLAGNTSLRTYVYTWVTPWGEESLPSIPSNEVYVKEGQTVDLSSIPFVSPSNNTTDLIRGIRLYRSVTTTDSSDYFLLKTIWFPTASVLGESTMEAFGDDNPVSSPVSSKVPYIGDLAAKLIMYTHSVGKFIDHTHRVPAADGAYDGVTEETNYHPGFAHNLVAGDVCQMVHNFAMNGAGYSQRDGYLRMLDVYNLGHMFGRTEMVIKNAPDRYTLEMQAVGDLNALRSVDVDSSNFLDAYPIQTIRSMTDVQICYSMNESDAFINIDENYEPFPAAVTPTTRTISEAVTATEDHWSSADVAGDDWFNTPARVDGTNELIFIQSMGTNPGTSLNPGTFAVAPDNMHVMRGYRDTTPGAYTTGFTITRLRAKNKYARFFHGPPRSDHFGGRSNLRYRTSNIATIKTQGTHNLETGEIVTISGFTSSNADFNAVDVAVTVVDHETFTYPNTGSNVANNGTVDGNGRIKRTGFRDDFDVLNLSIILPSRDYDAPPEGLKGLRVGFNNILMGFFDNQLCFSFPEKPHAWPEKYRMSFDYDIVAVETIGGITFVMTEGYPYQVSGADPATMASARIDTFYPCVSKRSVVNMGYGVVYATVGGLASFSPGTGLSLITGLVHDWETWEADLDASTIVGHYYDGKYFGCHSTGSFIFERDDKIGGYLVSISTNFEAAYTDTVNGQLYFVDPKDNSIYEWDNPKSSPTNLEWKSKIIRTPNFMNLGAIKIIGDYTLSETEVAAITTANDVIRGFNLGQWLVERFSYPYKRLDENNAQTELGGGADGFGINQSSPVEQDENNIEVEGGDFFKIHNEIFYVRNKSSDSLTVVRAMLGTTQAAHINNSHITYFKVMPLGTINGPYDYENLGNVRVDSDFSINSHMLNGDNKTKQIVDTTTLQQVTFSLYVDRKLIFTGRIDSNRTFRLPTGYKSDTFEIEVSGDARIREIQIGETPYGLRSV